jgi:glutamine kinase
MGKINQKYFSTNSNTTKSNVLKFLQNKIKYSKIEKIFDFTILEWKNEKDILIKKINKEFLGSKIIIRSSARGEDSLESSMAGNYLSIMNINSRSPKQVKNAINSVINSYIKKGNNSIKNQILIQTQTTEIVTSGVIFTKSSNLGAPYYIINFEDGESTDNVTKGFSGNTIKIFKKNKNKEIPEKWKNLIKSIKEIESILNSDSLDIEFGIKKNLQVIIFQVRPITSIKKNKIINLNSKITKQISNNIKKFEKLNNNSLVSKNNLIFSDMSDWNPAEIIGNNPNSLDYSLYEYLIMDKTWYKGRELLGYENLKYFKLIEKFGNKPYVNVNLSFNSLLPKIFNKKIKKKLLNFYFHKLISNPQFHDKVEFEIILSCYDLNIDDKLKELQMNGFTKEEVITIKKDLIHFTNNIITIFPSLLEKFGHSLDTMSKNRKNIMNNLKFKKNNQNEIIKNIEKLLDDAKNLGVIQFSAMARIAFIGSAILKSLRKKNIISDEFIQNFMNSIESPLSEIQNDLELYLNGKLSKKEFLTKYGHLRPGTYDITAIRYDKNKKIFQDIKHLQKISKKNITVDSSKIDKILLKNKLKYTEITFLDFLKNSLVQREQLKFEFTKNLSDVIELISKLGKNMGFSKMELANLTIKDILAIKKFDVKKIRKIWKQKIKLNGQKQNLNNFLILPPIIFSEKDFKVITHYIAEPNFITNKEIKGDIIYLSTNTQLNPFNKIVLIENADPGYDWIFTKKPIGLITKYGGVASHMAIRCFEVGLPAVIGCGEIMFEKLHSANRVMLDCKNQQIIILENKKLDQYMEEKKILKSLGYIK